MSAHLDPGQDSVTAETEPADCLSLTRSSAEETAALRRAVLRPHLPIEQMTLAGDQSPDTAYLAVRARPGASRIPGALLGCVRLEPMPCPWPDVLDPLATASWQLRAMATDPSARGTGLGRMLVDAAVDHVTERAGDLIWCNARVRAEGFYSRLGFQTVTSPFLVREVPEQHVGMIRRLGQ